MIPFAALIAFVLDMFLGDPEGFPHPVVFLGKMITRLETYLRSRFAATPEGERAAGRVLAVCLPWERFSSPALRAGSFPRFTRCSGWRCTFSGAGNRLPCGALRRRAPTCTAA